MRRISKRGTKGAVAVAISSVALSLLTAGGTAHADPAPTANDIVGVGSDTLQYMLDFGADGDYLSNFGYNAGKLARLVSFDATPDANARAGYLNGSTSAAQLPLNPTIVLRSGKSPVQRPNGSGAGIGAMLLDTGSPNQINFARSSSPLSAAQVTAATASGGIGNLHEVRLAHDFIHVAKADTSNAVPLSKAQLFQIYQCNSGFTHWNDAGVGGATASSDTIIPIVPQKGSGTRKTFLTDIGFTVNADNSTTPALGACVKTFEENDPYALYVDSNGVQVADPYSTSAVANPDAIEPMSDGRLNMYAANYFKNPNLTFGQAVPAGEQGTLNPTVTLITAATASDGGATYVNERGLYIIFRDADVTSTSKFNGSTKNWVNTLFYATSGTPFFKGSAGQALLASAGVVPDYGDCGVNPTSASPCPPFSP